MKTQEQIDEQIKLLKEARPKIVPTSMFGNDNLVDDFPMQKDGE